MLETDAHLLRQLANVFVVMPEPVFLIMVAPLKPLF